MWSNTNNLNQQRENGIRNGTGTMESRYQNKMEWPKWCALLSPTKSENFVKLIILLIIYQIDSYLVSFNWEKKSNYFFIETPEKRIYSLLTKRPCRGNGSRKKMMLIAYCLLMVELKKKHVYSKRSSTKRFFVIELLVINCYFNKKSHGYSI